MMQYQHPFPLYTPNISSIIQWITTYSAAAITANAMSNLDTTNHYFHFRILLFCLLRKRKKTKYNNNNNKEFHQFDVSKCPYRNGHRDFTTTYRRKIKCFPLYAIAQQTYMYFYFSFCLLEIWFDLPSEQLDIFHIDRLIDSFDLN